MQTPQERSPYGRSNQSSSVRKAIDNINSSTSNQTNNSPSRTVSSTRLTTSGNHGQLKRAETVGYGFNKKPLEVPAHMRRDPDRPLTVFEKPATGNLLYVRKPVVRTASGNPTKINDDEDFVRKDTERRQALGKNQEVKAEHPLEKLGRERRAMQEQTEVKRKEESKNLNSLAEEEEGEGSPYKNEKKSEDQLRLEEHRKRLMEQRKQA
jgi:hypothetical protein